MHVEAWNKVIRWLKLLNRFSIVCHVLCKCGNRDIELLGFSDSSGEAYSPCIYVLKRCSYETTVKLVKYMSSRPIETIHNSTSWEFSMCVFVKNVGVFTGSTKSGRSQQCFVGVIVWWHDVGLKRFINGGVASTSNPSDISTRSVSLKHLDFLHWFHCP